ncbi:phosphopantetheine-binding protein, partial [Paenibacillus turpanensis]|uniref:phosphopantetheine-binding protein n=1 Tax=Paenibacillus turpanensis TaxID=2689078 RepID=UPI0014091FC5
PGYMVPSHFVQLAAMPVTANGKLDRKALPEPDGRMAAGGEYVAPRSEKEAQLAAIWQELLQAERVGVRDDFFVLGGHSLKATMLASRIHKQFEVDIPLRSLFELTTVEQQAAYLEQAKRSRYVALERTERREWYPVSSAQKRLFILEQFEQMGTSYNIPEFMAVEGPL